MALNYLGLSLVDEFRTSNVVPPAGSTFTFYTPPVPDLVPLYSMDREYTFKVSLVDTFPTEEENFDNLMEFIETQLQQEIGDNFNTVDNDWDLYAFINFISTEIDKLHKPSSITDYKVRLYVRMFKV